MPDGSLELRRGTDVVARIPVVTPALRRGAPLVRELDVDHHHVTEVRIPVRGRPTEEVWIGDVGVRPARVIWSGIVGPKDADEETAIFVEVTPERIFEYQTAAQVTRCDGEDVRLFPRAWDFASARFRPITSTPPPIAAVKLTARRGDPAMPLARPMGGFHFTAASSTAAAGADARGLAAPTGLDDGDAKTVWAEGLGGDGRGEFLTARASAGRYRVRGLRIVPGDASTPATFKSSNRLKTLALALGPEPARRFEVEFPEDPAAADGKSRVPYWIALPVPVESACLTVAIRDVYRGTDAGGVGGAGGAGGAGGGRTAISDMEVFTELDDPSGVERLIADVAAGPDCPSRVPLLIALGEPAVLPAAQTILGASGVGRECLIEALARIDATVKSGVALDALAAALSGATAVEEQLIIRTLRKADAPPVRAVAALLESPKGPPGDRARAAHVLGELGGEEATAALVAAAGTNVPEVRLAIVQALGRAPAANVSLLVAAIDEAHRGTGDVATRREADFLRALLALTHRAPAGSPAAIEALRRSLASGRSFEIRARAIMAMGAIGDPTVVVDLAGVRDHSDDAVLRFLATRELGGITDSAGVGALRGALVDRDPRVRETAAEGLGHSRDRLSEPALIQAAKDEPWPFARRAQIEALSRLCGAPGRDLLMRAMERDVDEVRRAALAGLVRCHDPRSRPVVLSTLKARRSSATLRELAATLVGEIGDRSDANALAEILAALVNEAEGDLAIEGVAVSALRSLAHLGGPQAARAAARLAVDARHPYRHVAVEALGQICDGDVGAKALTMLRSDPDTALAAAAQASEQECQTPVAPRPKPR